MNILITGACAPISADLAQALSLAGHRVVMSDSSRWPIGRFSPYSRGFTRTPAPAKNYAAFVRGIHAILRREAIDRIIPTSEEVFWLAQDNVISEKLFAPKFEMLNRLHHKAIFAQMAQDAGAGPVFVTTATSREDVETIPASLVAKGLVAKPVYSRFGSAVLLKPSREELLSLDFSREWVIQSYVRGTEVCVYAVAQDGGLRILHAYRPAYRAGPGASVYFEPVADPRIDAFVAGFISRHGLTGQISFDVMLTTDGLVAIECNPRGTSGIHLASQHPEEFADALLNPGKPLGGGALPAPRLLGIPFLAYHGLALFKDKSARLAWNMAKDASSEARLPLYSGVLATCELVAKAALAGVAPTVASTLDFEWNGERG